MLLDSLPVPLPLVDQLALIRRAQLDHSPAALRARNKVVETNLRLVLRIARRYEKHGLMLDELVAEGSIGLITAIEKFDARRGHAFSTYASWWVRHHIQRAIANKGRLVRVPVHRTGELVRAERHGTERDARDGIALAAGSLWLDQPLGGAVREGSWHDVTPPELAVDDRTVVLAPDKSASVRQEREFARRLVAGLPDEKRRLLELRYGLSDGDERTLQQVADVLRSPPLSRERVRQLEEQTLAELRSLLGHHKGDAEEERRARGSAAGLEVAA